jgi:Ca-activated chloride channel family protein
MKSPIEKLLEQDVPPAPDPKARLAARRAALEEFARVHAASPNVDAAPRRSRFQGLLEALRLSSQSQRRDVMPWYSRPMLIGGAASVCLAIVGGTLVWNMLRVQPQVARLEVAAAPQWEPARPETANPPDGVAESAPATHTDAGSAAESPAPAREDAGSQLAKTDRAGSKVREPKPVEIPEAEVPEPIVQPADSAPGTVVAGAAAPAAAAKEEEMENVIVTGERRTAQASMTMTSPQAPVSVDTGRARRVGGPPGKSMADSRVRTFSNGGAQGVILTQPAAAPPPPVEGRDRFEHFELNSIKQPAIESERVSTFSADVDTSSYSFVRRQLEQGVLPQKDAVRVEEMVNYFDYSWPAAESREQPFRPTVVVSDSPWGKGRKLIHIGIKGYELPARERPDANLVMLLDVSGSMDSPDKLPLVKESMKLLLGSLKPSDSVGIVVYAGAAGMVLPPTPVGEKEKIVAALDRLEAGGSTAGAAGIELAYQLAEKSFRKEGVNRILLCTDGDFNVGIDGTNELKGFVERKREKGIFLSVLGFGQGNYRDELAQALAQNGNGVAAYIDTLNEARKVLVQEAGASLFTIAKDVKFQVEFNPATVAEYRLVGYETRALKREDFNNDAVDAGDVGAGHTVTAIYEITPVGSAARMVDAGRYAKQAEAAGGPANEYGYLKIRYKLPSQSTSRLIETPIGIESGRVGESIRRDVAFSTAVAGFAQLLRGGQFTGSLSYADVIEQAQASRGEDPYGYRSEFVQLVRKAQNARGM